MQIDYNLTGFGSADCSVSHGDARCDISASYIVGDGFGDLVASALSAISGERFHTFSFAQEPGTYLWTIRRIAPRSNLLRIEILDWHDSSSDRQAVCLFSTVCTPMAYAKAVRTSAETLLARFDFDGYSAKWGHPFPKGCFRALCDRIDSVETSWTRR